MTIPSPLVNTVPFCGACGWDVTNHNLNDDVLCDACGADLLAFGFKDLLPPTQLEAVSASGGVDFSWTANPDADFTESHYAIDNGAYNAWVFDTSPTSVPASSGSKVHFEVRSSDNGVKGPSRRISGTAL
jgi:hypothetical protein